jgi:hypothetical protein
MAKGISWRKGNSSSTELVEVQQENQHLNMALEFVQESLRDALLRVEDVGWKPLGEEYDGTEYPLESAKKNSVITRALVTINPLVKRGMNVRTAYIWGNGVEFKGIEKYKAFAELPSNKKWLLSPKAHAEMEMCLGTDGNFFLLLTKGGRASKGAGSVQRLPMHQITGTISNPDNLEEVWFYRREWTSIISNPENDRTSRRTTWSTTPPPTTTPPCTGVRRSSGASLSSGPPPSPSPTPTSRLDGAGASRTCCP